MTLIIKEEFFGFIGSFESLLLFGSGVEIDDDLRGFGEEVSEDAEGLVGFFKGFHDHEGSKDAVAGRFVG